MPRRPHRRRAPLAVQHEAARRAASVVTAYLQAQIHSDGEIAELGNELLCSFEDDDSLFVVAQIMALDLVNAVHLLAEHDGVDPVLLWQQLCVQAEQRHG